MYSEDMAEADTRIALYLPALRSGGAGRVMMNLARAFSGMGIATEIVISKSIGTYLNALPDNIRLIGLGCERGWPVAPMFLRYLRRRRPTHILSTVYHANSIAPWVARLSGVGPRVVVHQQTTLTEYEISGWRYRRPMYLNKMRINYRLADAVLVNSRRSGLDLLRHRIVGADRIRIVPNPIFEPSIIEREDEPVGHPWLATPDVPVIVGAGRMDPVKDFPTLLRAFSLLRRRRQARLLILGEGEELEALRALSASLGIASDVDLPGFVKNPYAYFSAASVFVHSSRWEGFGNVLVEAMAVGTPIVATDCPGGPREILQDGRFGQLVPVGDAEALAVAIEQTLSNPPASETLRQRARAFSIEAVAPRFLNILFGDNDDAEVFRPA
jgi:glycosyltransferase involved in cell wall biosynthesis